LQQQDRTVISDLYDAYGPALYGVALRVVQIPELAEQVVQDAFVKIWRNGASYDATKGRLFTWMLNIVRNTAIDATRSAQFKQRQTTDAIDVLTQKPSQQVANTDTIGLRDLVNNLEEKYRLLVDLIYFQGYTQEEAAEATDIPLGTIKTRLRFAIGELRKAFT
jgi:RNA polymerase sigma factor (sigma-70 family)